MNRSPRRIFNGRSARTMARIENLHFIKLAAYSEEKTSTVAFGLAIQLGA